MNNLLFIAAGILLSIFIYRQIYIICLRIKINGYDRMKIMNDCLEEKFFILEENGFIKSPFNGERFGRYNSKSYTYKFCKLVDNKLLLLQLFLYFDNPIVNNFIIEEYQIVPKPTSIVDISDFKDVVFPNMGIRLKNEIKLYCYQPSKLRFCFFQRKNKILILRPHYLSIFKPKYNVCKFKKQIEDIFSHVDEYIDRWERQFSPCVTDREGHLLSVQPKGTPLDVAVDIEQSNIDNDGSNNKRRAICECRFNLLNEVMTNSFSLIKEEGFIKSPFKKDKFGKVGSYKYSYIFYKMAEDSIIQLSLWCNFKEPFINAELNIFNFEKTPCLLSNLTDFKIKNKSTAERLDGRLSLMPHILERYPGRYLTVATSKYEWQRKILKFLIMKKLAWAIKTINVRIKRWHELYIPFTINQSGEIVGYADKQ